MFNKFKYIPFAKEVLMKNHEDLLSAKRAEIQRQLNEWATSIELLKTGDQIEFSMRIVRAPEILSMKIKDILTMERCLKLGIGKLTRGHLLHRIGRGYINFGTQLETDSHAVETIGDLIKFSGAQLSKVKCFGKSCRTALQKILKSLEIEWE